MQGRHPWNSLQLKWAQDATVRIGVAPSEIDGIGAAATAGADFEGLGPPAAGFYDGEVYAEIVHGIPSVGPPDCGGMSCHGRDGCRLWLQLRAFWHAVADLDSDSFDFLTLQSGFGSGTPFGTALLSDGDANHDGFVSHMDRFIWRSQFGTPSALPPVVFPLPMAETLSSAVSSQAVPEPATGVLLVVCLACLFLWRCQAV